MSIMSLDLILCLVVTLQAEEVEQLEDFLFFECNTLEVLSLTYFFFPAASRYVKKGALSNYSPHPSREYRKTTTL